MRLSLRFRELNSIEVLYVVLIAYKFSLNDVILLILMNRVWVPIRNLNRRHVFARVIVVDPAIVGIAGVFIVLRCRFFVVEDGKTSILSLFLIYTFVICHNLQ